MRAADALPSPATVRALGAHAAAWRPFALLRYTVPATGTATLSTARIATGTATLASARGATPARACALLLRRLDAARSHEARS
ncbi:MAG: hypothetical protein Q8S73_24525 [Deltaproteobacteria bacterium]|nr:hypothetical protein [Myxococcales bacterium]MDP3217300.1 hypothetical protein [Deltaproteobacteria bacterium]